MYGVTFLNLDFSLRTQPQVELAVEKLQWSSEGGPEVATMAVLEKKNAGIGANAMRPNGIDLVGLLRSPVKVWNESGRVVWIGYVESVEVGGMMYSLVGMANHVQAMYTFAVNEGPTMTVQKSFTDWVADLGSQAIYGKKDKILSVGALTAERATSIRDQALSEHSRPRPAAGTARKGSTLTCRGWYATLGWTYYTNPAGMVGYTVTGTGGIGIPGTSRPNSAQSWQSPTSGWNLDAVWLKVGKAGAPGDNFLLTLVADNGGVPGGTVLASCTVAASTIGKDYTWIKFPLSPVVTVGAGIYWFTLARSGSYDVNNYVQLKTNITRAYSGGVLRNLTQGVWAANNPDSDLNFLIQDRQETTGQIAAIVGDAACGQFLAGVVIEGPSGLYSCQYRDGTKTGLQEIKTLLASGNSSGDGLVALVDAGRVLHVRSRSSGVQLTQGADGVARDAYGQVASEDLIAAQWVRIEGPGQELFGAQFVTRVQVDGAGNVSLGTE